MANINRAIRLYQPNDPYYWQVDNLPLTDLLDNDIVLEERLGALEATVRGFGDSNKGAFPFTALADLKAWVEPATGATEDFGKVYVRPGKFNARMQLPASRESGWRMMRDSDANFNNTSFDGDQGLNSTTLADDFVRFTRGVGRTSVVELYPNSDGSDKSVVIESFDASEFNSNSAPAERLDLVYIKATGALDTDHTNIGIPLASVGVIKGAYFRTDEAAGAQANGSRFETETGRLAGRMTGMASSEITTGTNFGSVPSPDDLTNFAWHPQGGGIPSQGVILGQQVETQAAFTLPVAYVRVPQGYVTGQPIPIENVLDIRPFLRSTELTYNERAALVASNNPAGSNPFVTDSRLMFEVDRIDQKVSELEGQVNQNTANVDALNNTVAEVEADVTQLKVDVQGTAPGPTPNGLNHEGRIAALENSVGGGISIPVERHKFLSDPGVVFQNATVNQLGTASNPREWEFTTKIPPFDRQGIVAVQFRIISDGGGSDTDSANRVFMQGGSLPFRLISLWGVAQSNGDLRRNYGSVNTFYAPVNKSLSNGTVVLRIQTYATGSNDVNHTLIIDGYITTEYNS